MAAFLGLSAFGILVFFWCSRRPISYLFLLVFEARTPFLSLWKQGPGPCSPGRPGTVCQEHTPSSIYVKDVFQSLYIFLSTHPFLSSFGHSNPNILPSHYHTHPLSPSSSPRDDVPFFVDEVHGNPGQGLFESRITGHKAQCIYRRSLPY